MKVIIIVQARMCSSRLPGKVMKVVQGRPLLAYLLERLQLVKNVEDVVIATSQLVADNPIVDFCCDQKVSFYRGSELDVLLRYYNTACEYDADVIVRITADCPFIDPEVIEAIIKEFTSEYSRYDYISNTRVRTFPRGLDVEVFSFESLKKSHFLAFKNSDREHVTPYIYNHPKLFELADYKHDKDLSCYRLTVDTLEDFELIQSIILSLQPFKPLFNWLDVLELLDKCPHMLRINSQVQQKKVQ